MARKNVELVRMSITKVALGGRVKDQAAKATVAKALERADAAPTFVDTVTGQIKSKKPKKEKTPEQLCTQELRGLQKRPLVWQLCCMTVSAPLGSVA